MYSQNVGVYSQIFGVGEEMIPKTIHYCWFGGAEKSAKAQKCIASWKKYCPDYEIVEWNESNFDLDQHPYLKWCHDNKKWAFLSDFARLIIVYQNGGIYFDTDVQVVRSLDELLEHEAFYGFETEKFVNTGEGFGAEAQHLTVGAMLSLYQSMQANADGTYTIIGCPNLNTKALELFGLEHNGKRQTVGGAAVYPIEYFNPYDDPTGKLNLTPNTYSIHWYAKTWMNKGTQIRSILTKPLHRLLGKDFFRKSKG